MEKKRGQVQLNYWRTKFLNICIHSENDNLAKKKKKIVRKIGGYF